MTDEVFQYCEQNGLTYYEINTIEHLCIANKKQEAIEYTRRMALCNENLATQMVEMIEGTIKDLDDRKQSFANYQIAQQSQNIPKCPICQSTNLSKITNTSKAMKIAMFGVFGMGDNGKTWKCNNCGSKF